MQVELHDGLGKSPIVIDNPSVVIIRQHGEIIFVASEHASGGVSLARPRDQDFERICHALGLQPPKVDVFRLPAPPVGATLLR